MSLSVKRSQKSPAAAIVFGIFLVLLIVAARIFNLGERLGELREWILSLGALGPFVYMVLYAVAVVLALPGSVITILAGVLFGSLIGTAVVSVASTLGASMAFVIARHIARDAVAERLSKNKKFHRLDQMTHDYGAIIVAITRLIPLFPFNLLNYGFGLTKVSFRTYLFWSWLCMLPGTVLFVVGADAVTKAVSEGHIPWALVVIFAATVSIIVLLVRHARKLLKAREKEIHHER